MSFVHTIYLENGYRFSVPDNDLADVAPQSKKHKMQSQKAHLWAENYNAAIQFCQELFSKNFLTHLPPESQKKKAPLGSLAEFMKIALSADLAY